MRMKSTREQTLKANQRLERLGKVHRYQTVTVIGGKLHSRSVVARDSATARKMTQEANGTDDEVRVFESTAMAMQWIQSNLPHLQLD